MRIRNTRRLTSFAGVKRMLVFCLLVTLAACSEDSGEDHLERGRDYAATGNQSAAVLELKTALQKDETLAEARSLLGLIYLQQGDTASAAKELQRAVWMDWQPNLTVPSYASALLAQGNFTEVIKLSAEGLNETARASLYASQGDAYIKLGKNRDARRVLAQSLQLAPNNPDARLALARLDITLGNTAQAQASLDALIAQFPGEPRYHIALGDLYRAQSNPGEAAAAYDMALALTPDDLLTLEKRALLALGSNDLPAARQSAIAILKLVPGHPMANFVQGIVELQAARYEAAEQRLARAEPIAEVIPSYAFYYASALLFNDKVEMATVQAQRFYAQQPGSVRGRKLLAIIELQRADFAEAERLLRPVVREYSQDTGALQLMATALIRQGRTDEGIAMLARVAELDPDSARAQISLGAGLLLQGDAAAASERIKTAISLDPQYQQAESLLVLSLVQQQEYAQAIEAAREYAGNNPQDPLPQNLVAWVQLQSGDTDAALASYQAITQRFPGEPGAHHALAQAALADDDIAGATAHYETVLAAYPDHLTSLIQLALLDAGAGRDQQLVSRLEQAIRAHPGALQPRLLLARFYLANNSAEKVATAFIGLGDQQQREPDVVQLTAIAQLQQREHKDALFTLGQLNAADTDSASFHYLTAMAAAGSGDAGKTEEELDRALQLNPDMLPARLARARLMARQQRRDELRADLAVLQAAQPDAAEVLSLQAQAASLDNNAAGAVAFARKAHAAQPSSDTLIALGNYLAASDKSEAAAALYRNWLAEHPQDNAARTAAANLTLREGGEAQAQYLEVLERDPDNIIALNNLAWLTREQDPRSALAYAQKAEQLAPDNPSVLDTLAMVELENGDYAAAERAIERALKQSKDVPDMHYHAAVIAARAGDSSLAIARLEALLAQYSDFAEADAARTLLNELIDSQP